ncbi:MAG: SDR family NAD(P)-dependent oxidoreductase [Solirubrobacterales bacterium]
MGDLHGKVALITGAARGQGAAHAVLFARHGAKVILTDVLDAQGAEVAASIEASVGEALYRRLDVSDAGQWAETVAAAEVWAGEPVTVLVNNAGVLSLADVLDTDDEEWNRVIGINQYGVLQGMKHVIPGMIEAGGGSIVNVASVFGVIGAAGYTAYQASKGAVLAMTRGAALSYAKDNIRVNTICPGLILTRMAEEEGENAIEEFAAEVPLKRGADPSEVSEAALFLASERSSYITGVDLNVDGGMLAG